MRTFNQLIEAKGGLRIPTGAADGLVATSDEAGNIVWTEADAVTDDDPRLTDARTPTAHATSHAPGGTDELSPTTSIEAFRSSEVATLPRQMLAATVGTLASGTHYAARALVRKSGNYTKIRFATGVTQPSGTYTDCRASVLNLDGTVNQQTANEFATVIAASTVYELSLGGTFVGTRGDVVWLGLGFIASTMPTIRGMAASAQGINALTPTLTASRSGAWTTGNPLPAITSLTTGNTIYPWIELVP